MITLTPFLRSFAVSFTPCADLDIVGYKIRAVSAATLAANGGVFPFSDEGNVINEGPETSFLYTLPVGNESGTWYVTVAGVDTFGEDVLNYSDLKAVTVPTFQLLPDEMYTAGRTDFIIKGSIFNFGIYTGGVLSNPSTLYWTDGSIIRGDAEYTLTASNLTTAQNSYIIATLNTDNTATISKVTFSASYPTLTSNQVIIAVTSPTPSSAGNYLCYVRQANSIELEGAIIRDATITNAQIKELDAAKIKSGSIDLYWDNGAVKAVKSSYADTTSGIFLGIDGVVGSGGIPKMNLGNVTNYLKWDGTDLTMRGKLTADDIQSGGTITGSTIQTSLVGERMVVSQETDKLEFFDASNIKQVSVGTATDGVYNAYVLVGNNTSNSRTAIVGLSLTGMGIIGDSYSQIGVYGGSNTNSGVQGMSHSGKGVSANSVNGWGLYAWSSTNYTGYFDGGLGVKIDGALEVTGNIKGKGVAKVYGVFTGTTVTKSQNISSVTWPETGIHVVNFAITMPDVNYTVVGSGSPISNYAVLFSYDTKTTTSVRIGNAGVNIAYNPVNETQYSIVIFE